MPIKSDEVLHHIRVKLYPSYLPGAEDTCIARTDNEASLTIEQVCSALKNRGGFTGNYDDLVEYVKQYLDEMAYQLCDGFAVNTGYFSVHPTVGGTFSKTNEGHDREKHPITFRFRTRAPLRAIAEHIVVDIEGLADMNGYIDEFIDISTESINETLTPKGLFSISGNKIRVAGDNAAVGVFFVSVSDSTHDAKVEGRLAENAPSKVIGSIPDLPVGKWKVRVVTQYSSGSFLLKEPRVIDFRHELTVT
jgi:hypothetical protein